MAALDENHLAEMHRRAATTFPALNVPLERFTAALAASVATSAGSLEELHTDDLYLAIACLQNDPQAIALLEREVFAAIRPSLERVCRDGDVSVDDVLQWTREKLLVGDDAEAPKLRQYTGRGSLLGWIRVVAVREALQDRRKVKRERLRDSEAMLEGSPGTDLELTLLRQRYGASFRSAVEGGLRALTPEQRSILRFHTCDGLTIDQLAPMLGVHRATAARRLEKARTDALEHTRRLLRETHGLSESEARSLCMALGDDVDVSISRALGEASA